MRIANIDLGNQPVFLAPMEDITDPSFRYLCKKFGADMMYTEFISSDGLIRDGAKSVKKLDLFDYERPMGIQLYGHIAGAYRISPLTLSGEEYFGLDPDKPVVTYCWTGQTSSVIAAYLDIIGYDGKTLKNGANAMIYSNLTSHKWATPTVDLPTE